LEPYIALVPSGSWIVKMQEEEGGKKKRRRKKLKLK
jgi:hypothetical protein